MVFSRSARIISLLVIDTIFFFIELITGYAVHSLALVADSFHMLNDVLSLIVALWAVKVAATGKATEKYSYGWQRAEILGALINGVFLVALCVTICLEAIQRFVDPPVIDRPVLILIVGCMGLVSNVVGLVLFHDHSHGHGQKDADGESQDVESVLPATVVEHTRRSSELSRQPQVSERTALMNGHEDHIHEQQTDQSSKGGAHGNLNMRGVFLHVLGDFLGNLGVIATALFIWLTEFWWRFYFDPAVSLFITIIILSTAMPLCRAAGTILLQGTPNHLSMGDIKHDLTKIKGISNVHELHVWQLSDTKLVASAHITLDLPNLTTENSPEYMALAKQVRECFHAYGVHSSTIQPEFKPDAPVHEDACLLDCGEDCAPGKCCSGVAEVSDHAGHSH